MTEIEKDRNVFSTPTDGSFTPEPIADVVLSEEQLRITRAVRPATRVRLTKRIITELVTIEVPVRREELVVTHEPLEAGWGEDLEGFAPVNDGFDIILHEERVVPTTEVVAVEKVHVGIRTVDGEVVVTEGLARENVDLDTSVDS